jgi:hypothetical protein
MIGNRGFAAKLLSQETTIGRLDWRRSYRELRFERIEVPAHVEEQCRALLAELGLVFGCFDFVVTPEEEYVFLEVNEMGQFLFVERSCDIPILDAFASFLLQATIDFEWAEEEVRIRYSDPRFEALVIERAKAFAESHVSIPARLVEESAAPK